MSVEAVEGIPVPRLNRVVPSISLPLLLSGSEHSCNVSLAFLKEIWRFLFSGDDIIDCFLIWPNWVRSIPVIELHSLLFKAVLFRRLVDVSIELVGML